MKGCVSMRIYLDNCCLNRPYDDLRDDAVRMEAEAVIAIIDRCEKGVWEKSKEPFSMVDGGAV